MVGELVQRTVLDLALPAGVGRPTGLLMPCRCKGKSRDQLCLQESGVLTRPRIPYRDRSRCPISLPGYGVLCRLRVPCRGRSRGQLIL